MRFRLLVVGKPRAGPFGDAIRNMEARAGHYWPIDVREVRAGSGTPAEVRRHEGARLVKLLVAPACIVCDERGVSMDSRTFAAWIRRLHEAASDVDLVIGGAFGLSDDVRNRATKLLALAPWTLTHELARLVLAEQLYRAGSIVRGEPYHKD